MKGIQFGVLHSYQHLQLILSKKEVGSPSVKKREIEIEGADGVLDLTEFFGGVNYGNRLLKFEFSTLLPLSDYTEILNKLHGQKMQVIIDDDPAFFYYGRVNVLPYTNESVVGRIDIEVECEPYKKKHQETVVTKAISGATSITLTNRKMKVVPTITTTASMTFAFGSIRKTVSAGTFIIPELQLEEGSNTLTVTGTGTVTFRYREGDL